MMTHLSHALVLALCILFVSGPPCQATEPGPGTPDENPVLAEVNHEPIRLQDLRNYVSRHPLLRGYTGTREGIRMLLDDMINSRLLELEGRRRDIPLNEGESPQDVSYVLRVRSQLAGRCEPPDEAEARAFYDSHPELFSTPAYARVSRVYLPEDMTMDGQTAHAFLAAQAEAVRDGSTGFDEVVKMVRPRLPADARIGDMGFQPLAEEDPLIEAISRTPVGGVVGPFVRDGNVYLFYVTERREPILMPWSEVRAEAPKIAQDECRKASFKALREEMAKRFPVVIHHDVIEKLKPL